MFILNNGVSLNQTPPPSVDNQNLNKQSYADVQLAVYLSAKRIRSFFFSCIFCLGKGAPSFFLFLISRTFGNTLDEPKIEKKRTYSLCRQAEHLPRSGLSAN